MILINVLLNFLDMEFQAIPFFWALCGILVYLGSKLYFSSKFFKLAEKLPGPPTWPVLGNAFKDIYPDTHRKFVII